MELEFKKSTGVEKPHLFRQAKKDIARILTVLKENSKKIEPPQKEQKEKI
jgi:ribosomal protein L29